MTPDSDYYPPEYCIEWCDVCDGNGLDWWHGSETDVCRQCRGYRKIDYGWRALGLGPPPE